MLKPIRVIVACYGWNGPDLYFVKVMATDEQVEYGEHYEAAKEAASNDGYDSHETVAFDEQDEAGKAMLSLFDWDNASVVTVMVGRDADASRQVTL